MSSSMVNYAQAAMRHFDDAEYLLKQGRTANAGQLLGFHAECGLKALLVALGMAVDKDGSLQKPYREHINRLQPLITSVLHQASGRRAARYLSMMPNLAAFSDWHTDHRYWTASAIPPSLQKWQDAATEVGMMVLQAQKDGELS